MATSAISSSLLSYNSSNIQENSQQIKKEFQQLGQDLQSGNLSAAQEDFVTLQQYAPQSTSGSQSNNSIAQEFNQLGQDLQSGNISAAQQDYSTIQQDIQSQSQGQTDGVQGSRHHHHHGSGDQTDSQVSQLFNELGQDLQSGDLSGAQQVYATLQQDFQQSGGSQSSTSQSGAASVSVNA